MRLQAVVSEIAAAGTASHSRGLTGHRQRPSLFQLPARKQSVPAGTTCAPYSKGAAFANQFIEAAERHYVNRLSVNVIEMRIHGSEKRRYGLQRRGCELLTGTADPKTDVPRLASMPAFMGKPDLPSRAQIFRK
jgi:hypothetical protein